MPVCAVVDALQAADSAFPVGPAREEGRANLVPAHVQVYAMVNDEGLLLEGIGLVVALAGGGRGQGMGQG